MNDNLDLLKFCLILLIFPAAITSRHPKEKFCDFNGVNSLQLCYRKEILASFTHSPNQLAVDKISNTVYFSFDSGQGEYIPAKITIGDPTVMVLKGIKDAFAMAVDPDNGEIYFGGSHGIYRYFPLMKKLKRLALENLDIWWLVIRRAIYFVKFPSLNAYKYENRTVAPVSQLMGNNVHQFVFDADGNLFFINNSGLYGIKSQEYDTILLASYPRFIGMATDNQGHVYLCNEDGIYVLTKVVQTVKKVVNIDGVLGIAFDKYNNMIYSDSHDLVRLVTVARENLYIINGS